METTNANDIKDLVTLGLLNLSEENNYPLTIVDSNDIKSSGITGDFLLVSNKDGKITKVLFIPVIPSENLKNEKNLKKVKKTLLRGLQNNKNSI